VKWSPDEGLITAVRTGRCTQRYATMTPADRSWVVAGLTRAGYTAERMAELMGCSLRTVRVIKAEPMTRMAELLQTEAAAFEAELSLARSEHARLNSELASCTLAQRRMRANLIRVTSPRITEGHPLCARGVHRMTPYNTYENGGRRWCRECHRIREAGRRARKRAARTEAQPKTRIS